MRTLLLFCLCFAMIACSAPQAPIFKRMAQVKATDISTRQITITALAEFHNPNAFGGEVTATDIEVKVDDVVVGHIVQDNSIAVTANEAFSVPLTFNAKPKDIFAEDKNGVIGGILNAALGNAVKLYYAGTITVKLAGITQIVDVDYEEQVKLR